MNDSVACENTDREIWRGPDEGNGSYYADLLHITKEGALGINCGGMVYVRPIREWHRLAAPSWECKGRRQALPEPGECAWPGCGCDPVANKVLEDIDECGFEIVKKREPISWDANENRWYEPVETLATAIYNTFAYDGPGTKPAWMPGGNGTKQDEARFEARRRLRDAGHAPSVSNGERRREP